MKMPLICRKKKKSNDFEKSLPIIKVGQASIKDINVAVAHNIIRDEELGMIISIDFQLLNAKGYKGYMSINLYDENGIPLKNGIFI